MKRIDSQALEPVNVALGLTGAGAAETELLDGSVDQVLEVGQIARRGRTPGDTSGLFYAVQRNNHAVGAGLLQTIVNPYTVGPAGPGAYPGPIPRGLEIWLTGASATRNSGASEADATLAMRLPSPSQAWGVDNAGGAHLVVIDHFLAFWNGLETTSHDFFVNSLTEKCWMPLGLRVPRGALLIWSTESTGIAVYDLQLLLGLFPVALGQDAAV